MKIRNVTRNMTPKLSKVHSLPDFGVAKFAHCTPWGQTFFAPLGCACTWRWKHGRWDMVRPCGRHEYGRSMPFKGFRSHQRRPGAQRSVTPSLHHCIFRILHCTVVWPPAPCFQFVSISTNLYINGSEHGGSNSSQHTKRWPWLLDIPDRFVVFRASHFEVGIPKSNAVDSSFYAIRASKMGLSHHN